MRDEIRPVIRTTPFCRLSRHTDNRCNTMTTVMDILDSMEMVTDVVVRDSAIRVELDSIDNGMWFRQRCQDELSTEPERTANKRPIYYVTPEWDHHVYPNGELDADPCIHCDHEGFYNASLVVGAQYAQTGDHSGEYGIDEMGFERAEHVACGNCGLVLHDET